MAAARPVGDDASPTQLGLDSTRYRVSITTGAIKTSGSDVHVKITLFGEDGRLHEERLVHSQTNEKIFQRGFGGVGLILLCHIVHSFRAAPPAAIGENRPPPLSAHTSSRQCTACCLLL